MVKLDKYNYILIVFLIITILGSSILYFINYSKNTQLKFLESYVIDHSNQEFKDVIVTRGQIYTYSNELFRTPINILTNSKEPFDKKQPRINTYISILKR